jgi:hypothetical protein
LTLTQIKMPDGDDIYVKRENAVTFNQLAVKIEMDHVSNDDYYGWLDETSDKIGSMIPGARIVEKPRAREEPPLNIAIYYDTDDHFILGTGALLRTSCNRITHAFCAYKQAQDEHSVRRDHRYVFDGEEKQTIQRAPASPAAFEIVRRLMSRRDIEHPGTYLERDYGVDARTLTPAVKLDDYRYTFFAWLDGSDALRCSMDRATVEDLRLPEERRRRVPVSEVEVAIYPRVHPDVAADRRVVDMITALSDSLCSAFSTSITAKIKYQRAAEALGIG